MQHKSAGVAHGSGSRWIFVFLAFAGIALFFLFSEHRIHALTLLPLLFLLACPFLHMFMHGGHGGHGAHEGGGHEHGDHQSQQPDAAHDPARPLAQANETV